jgi:hypothetical protein
MVLRRKWVARITAIFVAANIAAIDAGMRNRITGLVSGLERVLIGYFLNDGRVYVECHVWPLSDMGPT